VGVDRQQFSSELGALVLSLDEAGGVAAEIREDLAGVRGRLLSSWESERESLDSLVQTLYALGIVAQAPDQLPPGDPLPRMSCPASKS
jgi:hypothetical protein